MKKAVFSKTIAGFRKLAFLMLTILCFGICEVQAQALPGNPNLVNVSVAVDRLTDELDIMVVQIPQLDSPEFERKYNFYLLASERIQQLDDVDLGIVEAYTQFGRPDYVVSTTISSSVNTSKVIPSDRDGNVIDGEDQVLIDVIELLSF